jgi:hypothetical protein
MADILLWSSFAVRGSDPRLADTMLTLYATIVLAMLVPAILWVRCLKPAAPAAEAKKPAAGANHLVWKPLRMTPFDHNALLRGEPQPVQPRDDEHLIYNPYGYSMSDGTEATDTFLLSDLKMEESVLAGWTTSGHWAYGVVTGYEEGKFFRFDGPNQGSLLWNKLLLMRGPAVDAIVERYQKRKRALQEWLETAEDGDCTPPGLGAPMKRTDSGTNYGFSGYPDVAFWKRSGCQLYWEVTADDYLGREPDWERLPDRIRRYGEKLEDDCEKLTEVEREALAEQSAELYTMFTSYIADKLASAQGAEIPATQRWADEQMERLRAAWELCEEGEVAE